MGFEKRRVRKRKLTRDAWVVQLYCRRISSERLVRTRNAKRWLQRSLELTDDMQQNMQGRQQMRQNPSDRNLNVSENSFLGGDKIINDTAARAQRRKLLKVKSHCVLMYIKW